MGQIDRFRVALALDEDPISAVSTIVRELAAQGQGGSIGFVYATDKFKADLGTITDMLRERTGVANWIGTIGLGIIAGQQGVFDKPALAAMIGTWPEGEVKILTTRPK